MDGDAHMRKRPIGPLVDALRSLGIDASTETGCPPVTVNGTGRFEASRVQIDGGLSSQYVSALLMMAAGGDRPVDVELLGERYRRARLYRSHGRGDARLRRQGRAQPAR